MHNAREVYWVPLGAVVEPTEVAAAVAKGIGISAHGQLHSERRRYFGWLISHLGVTNVPYGYRSSYYGHDLSTYSQA
jgi:hypothetical protein